MNTHQSEIDYEMGGVTPPVAVVSTNDEKDGVINNICANCGTDYASEVSESTSTLKSLGAFCPPLASPKPL